MGKAVIFDMFETLITHYGSPLYFGKQMAADAGIPEEKFQKLWHPTERERTIGKMRLEEALEAILKESQCYSKELLERIVQKRIQAEEECFRHMHRGILPLLEGLKEKGVRIGLISNCFSEEVGVIRGSILFPYFDAVCLSFEERVQKPDAKIYRRCLSRLKVEAEECLYVGDGGSQELEAAEAMGIKAVQAAWYLKEGIGQPSGRKAEFRQIEEPGEVWEEIGIF